MNADYHLLSSLQPLDAVELLGLHLGVHNRMAVGKQWDFA